ncbi:alpha/beta hydrolase [Portibacter marinus]|uniref:alpha/beta hydrolase n=1 Tax=Portibacter marinus TaxID=2898660 RepID=UPI001EEB2ABB|nr:alpha/beta hydrolase-fold protein [Portibacter marinus]
MDHLFMIKINQDRYAVKTLVFVLLFASSILTSCFAQQEKPSHRRSTALPNVIIPDTVFHIEGLNRNRSIRVYLPLSYNDSDDRYPVLYMHDGQNLFDDSTSFVGEWKVDEALNRVQKKLIVVGIDNGAEKRIHEMAPFDHPKYGHSEGLAYLNFIVNQVKPFVDEQYRTLSNRENTALMGSSLGGLITHFAAIEYSNIFGKVAIFSPSYWFSEQLRILEQEFDHPPDVKMYIIMGGEEGQQMINPAKEMEAVLKQDLNPKNLYFSIIEKGTHSENFWSEEFMDAINFLF